MHKLSRKKCWNKKVFEFFIRTNLNIRKLNFPLKPRNFYRKKLGAYVTEKFITQRFSIVPRIFQSRRLLRVEFHFRNKLRKFSWKFSAENFSLSDYCFSRSSENFPLIKFNLQNERARKLDAMHGQGFRLESRFSSQIKFSTRSFRPWNFSNNSNMSFYKNHGEASLKLLSLRDRVSDGTFNGRPQQSRRLQSTFCKKITNFSE